MTEHWRLKEAVRWVDVMAQDLHNENRDLPDSAEAGVELLRRLERVALAVLSAPTVRWCRVHKDTLDELERCRSYWTNDDEVCVFTTVALVPVED